MAVILLVLAAYALLAIAFGLPGLWRHHRRAGSGDSFSLLLLGVLALLLGIVVPVVSLGPVLAAGMVQNSSWEYGFWSQGILPTVSRHLDRLLPLAGWLAWAWALNLAGLVIGVLLVCRRRQAPGVAGWWRALLAASGLAWRGSWRWVKLALATVLLAGGLPVLLLGLPMVLYNAGLRRLPAWWLRFTVVHHPDDYVAEESLLVLFVEHPVLDDARVFERFLDLVENPIACRSAYDWNPINSAQPYWKEALTLEPHYLDNVRALGRWLARLPAAKFATAWATGRLDHRVLALVLPPEFYASPLPAWLIQSDDLRAYLNGLVVYYYNAGVSNLPYTQGVYRANLTQVIWARRALGDRRDPE